MMKLEFLIPRKQEKKVEKSSCILEWIMYLIGIERDSTDQLREAIF
jgi:hypothetical protein